MEKLKNNKKESNLKIWLYKFLFYFNINFLQRIFWFVGCGNDWETFNNSYDKDYNNWVLQLLEHNNWKFTFDNSLQTVKLKAKPINYINLLKDKLKNIDNKEEEYFTFWIGNYPNCYFNLYLDTTPLKNKIDKTVNGFIKSIIKQIENNPIYHIRPSKYTIYRINKTLQKQMMEEGWRIKYNNYLMNLDAQNNMDK